MAAKMTNKINSHSFPPSSRVMLISGTSRGIGKYLAQYYLSRGFKVIGCSRSPSNIENSGYLHFILNVADEPQVQKMLSAIRKTYGRLDYLLNNAAINPKISPVMLTSLVGMQKTFETNFFGTYLLSRESVKLMIPKKFGRIVNFGSMAAYHHVPGESAYTASKAAVLSWTRVFAKEVYSYGITCNVVSPAAIATDLSAQVDPAALKEVLKRNAIPEMGKFEDVSHLVNYLIDDQSHAMTGQTLYLGGV